MEKERRYYLVEDILQKAIEKEIFIDFPEEVFNWSSVSLSEITEQDWRLEARYFSIEGKHARELLDKCKWTSVALWSDSGFVKQAQYPGRFKRIYVEKGGIPFLIPSQINEINPRPTKFISEKSEMDINDLRVKKGNILLTRSGTTGNVTLVSRTLDGMVFSDDVIRIELKDNNDVGYVYAFLKSRIGQTLLTTKNYGAVISHIEPDHLKYVAIPSPEKEIKEKINDLIQESFELRDSSNELISKAKNLLVDELELPPFEKLSPTSDSGLNNYEVKLSALDERFDGSYHVPIINTILQLLSKTALEVTTIGDCRISERITLPGHFKRIYLSEGYGVPLIGGKQIYDLDASSEKYLALSRYSEKVKKELLIQENMVLISAKGTVGKVVLVPKHWDGWAISSNIISILPSSSDIAGYLYIFLSSSYGSELIERNIYGAVVDIIEPYHVAQVNIPILKNHEVQQRINNLALEANQKRYKAYVLEQEALRLVNDLVIYAQ